MNGSPLEVTWTIVAFVGLLFTLWMIIDANKDYRTVLAGVKGGYARSKGARWWIAIGALVSNSMLALMWIGFLLVGVLAIQYPAPPQNSEQSASSVWVGWILIGMEVLLATTQVWARVVRIKVVGRPHAPTEGA